MPSFLEIDANTCLSSASIRALRRDGQRVEIEFLDGTVRSYEAKYEDLAAQLVDCTIPAAPGWRVALRRLGQVAYWNVIAFRIAPTGDVKPITAQSWEADDWRATALIDPQDRFIDCSWELFDTEAAFVAAEKAAEAEEAAWERKRANGSTEPVSAT